MNRLCSIAPRLRAEMHSTGIPGPAVAVARKDEIRWPEAFGWAERELNPWTDWRKTEHPPG